MPREKWGDSLDHREPTWKDGREYQLVCGFETAVPNLRVCSVGENSRKSNRFVPWRVPAGWPPPEEPGDWAWFLNLDTLEWEFTQWCYARWFELTRSTCAEHFAGVAKACRGRTFYVNDAPQGAFKPGFLWWTDGETEKRVGPEQKPPRGFRRGRLPRRRDERGCYTTPDRH